MSFDQAFDYVVGHEGGFDQTREDCGNWTSGIVGVGQLRGTKYGISAAAYPDISIIDLTLVQAKAIYQRDYWNPIFGDKLPPRLSLLVFDAAVNNGLSEAKAWLQGAAGVTVDGFIGPITLAAATAADPVALSIEFHSRRLNFMASLSTWRLFGLGWSRRLVALLFQSLTMTNEVSA